MSSFHSTPSDQFALFETPLFMEIPLPGGFTYQEDFLTQPEEAELLEAFLSLPFKNAEHQGYEARRRMVWHSWQDDSVPPDYLAPLVVRAAGFAGISPRTITSALINEYSLGTPIGWHRDKPTIGHVIGISLGSISTFRLRRQNGEKWDRFSIPVRPRSIYCLSGESRTDWQHSLPPAPALRYSITLRDFRDTGR